MAKPADLEDLLQLKARGIIDDAEFSARKKLLARRSLRAYSQSKAKSGILYIFFAYFLGMTFLCRLLGAGAGAAAFVPYKPFVPLYPGFNCRADGCWGDLVCEP